MAKINNTKAATEAVAVKIAGFTASSKPELSREFVTGTPLLPDIHIPGLLTLTPDLLPGMMPPFQPSQYHVGDPLNPPENLPQVSQSQLDKGMRLYEGATRALKLTGAALDLTREKFSSIGKHAKAFGAGIQAATEIEKVKGNYIDYVSQTEITKQKDVALDINQVKTIADINIAIYSKDELDQKLQQAQIKASELRLKTVEAEVKLTSFKEQLGQYAEVGK